MFVFYTGLPLNMRLLLLYTRKSFAVQNVLLLSPMHVIGKCKNFHIVKSSLYFWSMFGEIPRAIQRIQAYTYKQSARFARPLLVPILDVHIIVMTIIIAGA